MNTLHDQVMEIIGRYTDPRDPILGVMLSELESLPWDKSKNEGLTISQLVYRAHDIAQNHGFWENRPEFGTAIALIHSELSEALEEDRAARPPLYFPCNNGGMCVEEGNPGVKCGSRVWNPDEPDTYCKAISKKPEGYGVELADAVIRIADLCGALHIDLERIISFKMEYNASRPYRHGKKY